MDISLRTTPPYLLLSHKISQHHRHYLAVKSSTSLSFPTNLNTYGPSRFSSTRPRPLTISTLSTSRARGIASDQLIGEDTTSKLDEVQVFGLDGKPIVISDLWKDRKAVVAFARHFGCVLCRKRADYLASAKDKMDAAGVALVLIGPGSVDQAKAFSEQTKFKGEVYADPSYSSYEALSFVSGISTTFTPKAGLKIIQSYMEGYRQDWGLSFEKDTRTRGGWQQGGIIVAGPGKSNISYVHKAKATKAKGTTLTRQKPNFASTFVGRVRFECSLIGWSDSRGVRRGVAQSGQHICFGYRGP